VTSRRLCRSSRWPQSLIAINAVTGKKICENLYVPQLEGPAWHVVNAATGDVITTIETKSGSHNTIYSADGSHVYLAGLNSKLLFVADTRTNQIASTVGPFDNVIRPFTVNGSNTLVFVNINGVLGFEGGSSDR
jgi:DNA-binding beta-propeller fold protein YncE